MSRLPRIQGDFQSYLLGGGSAAIEQHVVGTEKVPVATRLAIYGDGYTSRLIEALEANFPILSKLLGEDDFRTLGTAYVNSHPSPFFTVRYYGNGLAGFLASAPEYSGAPVLAELARWVWALSVVFVAAVVVPLGSVVLVWVVLEKWAE